VNLEDLVRAALAEEARAEPSEAGAYDRFMRSRRRYAWLAATSAGLAVALVLALVVGGVWALRGLGGGDAVRPATPAPTTSASPRRQTETTLPAPTTVPVSGAGVVRFRHQGFELTLPKGWKVDQRTTLGYYQFGQPWLVISPGGRPVSATRDERITIHTAVTPPSEYPGRPTAGRANDLPGQSFSTLSGHRSSGRRPDGRAYTVGDQGGIVSYMIAWPYRCAAGSPCPKAAPWRVLQLDVEGTGRQEGLKVRALARGWSSRSARSPTPSQPPGRAPCPRSRGCSPTRRWSWAAAARATTPGRCAPARAPARTTGSRRHARTATSTTAACTSGRRAPSSRPACSARSRERATAALLSGYGSSAVAKVVVELQGRPAVAVPTFRHKRFPFTFWVLAPIPPDVRPLAFTSFDAGGKRIARSTEFAGYPGGCR
jgi:hypothetical protein